MGNTHTKGPQPDTIREMDHGSWMMPYRQGQKGVLWILFVQGWLTFCEIMYRDTIIITKGMHQLLFQVF